MTGTYRDAPPAGRPLTDFGRHSHDELARMLFAGLPDAVHTAGDAWHQLGRGLHERADDITRQLATFSPLWAGGAADDYKSMMTNLAAGVRTVADTALACRDLVHRSGDSLRDAQARMPGPVPVTPVDATVAALAAGSLPPAVAAGLWEAAGPAGRAVLVQQVQTLQQQTDAAGSAHAEAVRVMTELAGHYVATEEAIPAAPKAAAPPSAPGEQDDDSAGPSVDASASVPAAGQVLAPSPPAPAGGPAAITTSSTPPLFTGVYASGLAAAGAAVAGLFGGRAGQLINRLKQRDKSTAKAKGGAGNLAGGMAGGSIGGGSGGHAAPTPVASPEITAGAGAGTSGGASAAVPSAGAAAATGRTMAGMPFVPMAGMGDAGAAAGAGRRIPPWLVETEDVWGESVVVTPPVIGDTSPAPRGRR